MASQGGAKALVLEARILLMDEPCSALDPIATAKIEELMMELKESYTLVVVTHNPELAETAGRCFHLSDGRLTPLQTT